LLVTALLLAVVAASRGEEAPQPQAAQAADDFADKVVMVYLDDKMRSPSWVLNDVEVKEIGGRAFLIGTAADTQRDIDWRAGRKIRISWPLVTGYMLFTAEEYAQRVKESKEDN
jgi:hypothetical protein